MENGSRTYRLGRVTRVATTAICLLCCIPQEGFCASVPIEQLAIDLATFNFNQPDLIPSLAIIDYRNYVEPFLPRPKTPLDDVADSIIASNDPLESTKKLIQAFINKINSINKTSLSMEDTCRLLRQNTDIVPVEYRESFYLAIDSIESKNSTIASVANNLPDMTAAIYWPWEWNWFGLNKPKKDHNKNNKLNSAISDKIVGILLGLIIVGLVVVAIFCPGAVKYAVDAIVLVATMLTK